MSEYKTSNGCEVSGPDKDGRLVISRERWSKSYTPRFVRDYLTRADLEAMLALFGGEGEQVCEWRKSGYAAGGLCGWGIECKEYKYWYPSNPPQSCPYCGGKVVVKGGAE